MNKDYIESVRPRLSVDLDLVYTSHHHDRDRIRCDLRVSEDLRRIR